MIQEVAYFLRHGPSVSRKQASMGRVEFQQWLAGQVDRDGLADLRSALVEDLRGEILEIGAGTGALFGFYDGDISVTAIEPDDEFRAAAQKAANEARVSIRVLPGTAESLPLGDATIDAVVASTVLCSVQSVAQALAEFKRVLKHGGELRLLEHVQSEHWPAGILMDLSNPIWLRLNKVGCNWNRRTGEAVRDGGFRIVSTKNWKLFSPASPAAFPGRLIRAER
jgi:ubiquinone/menaquinone biosynthesis C-methylase UbiE